MRIIIMVFIIAILSFTIYKLTFNIEKKYTVFISYDHLPFVLYDENRKEIDVKNMLIPFFEVDIKNKNIKGIREGFKKREKYYNMGNDDETAPKSFDRRILNPHDDYETEYIIVTNNLKEGEYFIDEKVKIEEKTKTEDNIRLFFELFFKDDWGKGFYEENIFEDIKNIEKNTGIYIKKITDIDQDGNLEFWIKYSILYGEGEALYEEIDNKLIFTSNLYLGGD